GRFGRLRRYFQITDFGRRSRTFSCQRDSFMRRLGARLANAPVECILEILKAGEAYPMVFVFGRVAFVQRAWMILDHELRPTEGAVVVVPVGVRQVAPVGASDQRDAFQEALLTLKSPVFAF